MLLLATSASLAAPSGPTSPGVFDLFVALDHQLTILDQQLEQSKTTLLRPVNSGPGEPAVRPWAQAARQMQPTVIVILRDSQLLEHTYRRQELRLNRPLFRRLSRRARMLRGNLRLLAEARTRRWARVVQGRLSKAMVNYVFDFQLVSGGYAALRCPAEQQACCEPVRKDPRAPFSCRWTCAQRASSCRYGFPGPLIGPGYEQPLSASR